MLRHDVERKEEVAKVDEEMENISKFDQKQLNLKGENERDLL